MANDLESRVNEAIYMHQLACYREAALQEFFSVAINGDASKPVMISPAMRSVLNQLRPAMLDLCKREVANAATAIKAVAMAAAKPRAKK